MTPASRRKTACRRAAIPIPPGTKWAACLGLLLAALAWTASQLAVSAAPSPNDAPRPHAGATSSKAQPPSPRPSEDIDRELFAPAPKPTQPSEPTQPSDPRAGRQRIVSPAAIVEQMLQSARRLGEVDSGPETQRLQQRILEDLEAILREVGKASSDTASSSRKPAGKPETEAKPQAAEGEQKSASAKPGPQPEPGQAGGSAKGPGGQSGSLADRPSLLRRAWGDLPPRQREELLQFQPPEEFLPEYEAEIEAYFRRLAEGHSENR